MKSDKYYSFCKKHKWFDWIDDNIIYYVYDKPKSLYRTIKHWFYCNFNKYHWRLLKNAWCSYPWDGSFLYNLEEAQIDKQIFWFEHHQLMIDEQYEQILRTLKLAKYCIHTINNEGDLYHFEGETEWKELDNGFNELVKASEYVYDGPKVNWNNASRFFNENALKNEYFRTQHNELYIAKCKNLYHKIRLYYTDFWWD